jgi:hypothetical protein
MIRPTDKKVVGVFVRFRARFTTVCNSAFEVTFSKRVFVGSLQQNILLVAAFPESLLGGKHTMIDRTPNWKCDSTVRDRSFYFLSSRCTHHLAQKTCATRCLRACSIFNVPGGQHVPL